MVKKTFLNLYLQNDVLCCLGEVNTTKLNNTKITAIIDALTPCLTVSEQITAKTAEGYKTVTVQKI